MNSVNSVFLGFYIDFFNFEGYKKVAEGKSRLCTLILAQVLFGIRFMVVLFV